MDFPNLFKPSAIKLSAAVAIAIIFVLSGIISISSTNVIGSVIKAFLLYIVLGYVIACMLVYDVKIIFTHYENLKRYTDVLKLGNYKKILIIATLITIGAFFLLYLLGQIIPGFGRTQGMQFLVVLFVAGGIAYVFLYKKDFFLERNTIFFLLYSFVLGIIDNVLNFFLSVGRSFFYDNMSKVFAISLLAVLWIGVLGFILGVIGEMTKNPGLLIQRKAAIGNFALAIVLFIIFVAL